MSDMFALGVTSEMCAKIRAADWRRAMEISAGGKEPCGGGSSGGLELVRFGTLNEKYYEDRYE